MTFSQSLKSKMLTVKRPDYKTINQYPKNRRVVAIVGDGCHGLWVVRNLGENGLCVLTVCNTPHGRARYSRYSAGVWALETSPITLENLDEIEKLVRMYDIRSIMTISEANHLVLIENRDRFEPDIHVFSPSADTFKKIIDKEYMRTLCGELGIPIAKGMVLAEFLKTPMQQMRYPRIMRTRQQHGEHCERNAPWKVAYASNEREFKLLVERVLPIADNIILQEYHPGVAYNINVVMHNGHPFFSAAFRGERDYPVAGGVTVQRVACESGAPFKHAVKLLKVLKYEGNAGVDFRYDIKTHEYIFTEINPRFEGGTGTLVRAGFDIAFLLWQSHFEPGKMKTPCFYPGLRTRDFKGCVGWLKQILSNVSFEPGVKRPNKLEAIASFLWHSGPWTFDDTFLWSDPKPYIAERLRMVTSRLPWKNKQRIFD